MAGGLKTVRGGDSGDTKTSPISATGLWDDLGHITASPSVSLLQLGTDYGTALIKHLRSTAKTLGITNKKYFQLCQTRISGYQIVILPVSTP